VARCQGLAKGALNARLRRQWIASLKALADKPMSRQKEPTLPAPLHRSDQARGLIPLPLVFDDISDGVILADTAGGVQTMNRAALRLFDLSAESCRGLQLAELMPGVPFVRDKGLRRLLKIGLAHTAGAELGRAAGPPLVRDLWATTLLDEEGQPQAILVMARDERRTRMLEELIVLHAVALLGVEAADEDTLIEEVTRIIGEALFPNNFGIMLLDDEGGRLVPHRSYRGGVEEGEPIPIPIGRGITGRVVRTGRSMRVADTAREPAYFAADPKTQSELCVPIKLGERVIGVINAENVRRDAYSLNDERLLTTVAGQLASAIGRLRLFEAERYQRHVAEVLRQTGVAMAETLDVQEVLTRLLEQVELVIDYAVAQVIVVDDGGIARVVAGRVAGQKVKGQAASLGEWAEKVEAVSTLQTIRNSGMPLCLQAPQAAEVPFAPAGLASPVSWMGAPMMIEGSAQAFLSFFRSGGAPYQTEQADLLQAFAAQGALAFQNARLFAELRRQASELSALYAAAVATSSILEPEMLLRQVGEQITNLLAADEILVVRYRTESDDLEVALAMVDGQALPSTGKSISMSGAGVLSGVIRTRQPALFEDLREGTMAEGLLLQDSSARSWMCVPLAARARVLGAVAVASRKPGAFGAVQRRFLEAVAQQWAGALDNAQLFEMTQRRAQEAETLRQSAAVVAATLHHGEAIERILKQLAVVVPYDSASVQVLKEGYLEIVGGRGWGDVDQIIGLRFPIPGDNPNTQVIQSGKPYVLTNATEKFGSFRIGPHSHIRSWLGVPLIIQSQVIGMLAVDSIQEDYFKPVHVRLASAFADHVAVALENASLFEATQRRASEFETLLKISSTLRSASSLDQVLPPITRHTAEAMGAARCRLYLIRREDHSLVWRASYPADEDLSGVVVNGGESALSKAAAGELQLTFSRSEDNALVGSSVNSVVRPATYDWLAMPLRSQERTVAVLELQMPEGRSVSSLSSGLLNAIADIAGNALARVEVMETLEERVRARTGELAEANELLKELDRLKSDFVSNVSHELRTPITNILLYLELLGQPGREPKRPSYMSVLKHEADRLARLIEDLLTLSRMEQGAMPFSPEPLEVGPLLDMVISAHEARAREKKIGLKRQTHPPIPDFEASKEQIVQVFTNLIDNAVAYTPAGGQVMISGEIDRRGSRSVVLRVHNTGPAIPPEDMPHLFERFYRGQTGRESGERGTGLGLAICKEIIDRHAGMIEVESTPSAGTTFIIHLPLTQLPV
jgi:signal transduction histidine kinase/putative methionine-R-sulfoxide reductase with GAF domain